MFEALREQANPIKPGCLELNTTCQLQLKGTVIHFKEAYNAVLLLRI